MSTDETRNLVPTGEGSLASATPEALLPKRRLVTVIGIDHYEDWPRLDNAVNDAVGIHELLCKKYGFESPIEPLINGAATKPAIESLVQDQLRETVQADDALVVFFAGHGHTRVDQVGNTTMEKGYLVPVEAKRDVRFGELLDIDHVLEAIGLLKARHILVVIDACNSGMALSSSVKYRSTATYSHDLASKLSRRVITSARAQQPALDGGPVPGHSLFTGTLIDGLSWGKADMDGDGIITSSELGLYLQQQVGNASQSKQTPDFGAFHLDDRGELLIALGEDDFASVKARAYSALQSGERTRFGELVERAAALRPSSPETVYLEYRRALASGELLAALERLNDLGSMQFDEGVLPLSLRDILDLAVISGFWWKVFSREPGEIPVRVQFLTGPSEAELEPVGAQNIGELQGYCTREGEAFALEVTNPTSTHQHVHAVFIGSAGNIFFHRLWPDIDLEYRGLAPGATVRSYPFRVRGTLGLEELWIFVSEHRVDQLVRPPATNTRSMIEPLTEDDARGVKLQKIYVLNQPKPRGEPTA